MPRATGYLVVVERPDGGTDYQLTAEGARVARQLAMSGEDGQDALLAALLGAQPPEMERPAPRGTGLPKPGDAGKLLADRRWQIRSR